MPPPTKQPTDPIERRSPEQLVAHADADRVPATPEGDYTAFRADVAKRGVLVPIEITAENVVLDGRQRLRAALELGRATVPVTVVAVADELDHMLRASIHRRHLTESQRAALVLELEEYIQARENGRRRQCANLVQAPEGAKLPPRGKTREIAAAWAGVSPRLVQDTQTVQEHDPALFERIKRGKVSANVAARQVRRRLRNAQLPPPQPLPEGPFDLILADPPWQLGHPDSPHAPEDHYPTLPLDEIKAIQLPVADDAMLFLWAVSSLLPEALEVMGAWGFEHKTTLCWVKDSIGPGVWLRNRHELLLVGRRGNHPPPDPEDRADSVLEAHRGRHSEKPEQLYRLLERMHPHAAKLELFARRRQPGWAAWGNEVPR
jgi:N6-adenosine-specific RNA methylase IME4